MLTVKIKIGTELVEIEARRIEGDFALHGSVVETESGYVAGNKVYDITHIPTGLRLLSSLGNLKKMSKALDRLAHAPSFSAGLSELQKLSAEQYETKAA